MVRNVCFNFIRIMKPLNSGVKKRYLFVGKYFGEINIEKGGAIG